MLPKDIILKFTVNHISKTLKIYFKFKIISIHINFQVCILVDFIIQFYLQPYTYVRIFTRFDFILLFIKI